MKYLAHVPTEQYGYISVEIEGTPEEAVEAYRALQGAWKGGDGLGMKSFAKVVLEYCTSKEIANGGDHNFSTNEKLLLGEIKKLLRK